MHDSCMVTASKCVSNLRQAMISELFSKTHRHLPRPSNRAIAALRQHVRHLDLVVFGHRALNIIDRHQLILQREKVPQRFLN